MKKEKEAIYFFICLLFLIAITSFMFCNCTETKRSAFITIKEQKNIIRESPRKVYINPYKYFVLYGDSFKLKEQIIITNQKKAKKIIHCLERDNIKYIYYEKGE